MTAAELAEHVAHFQRRVLVSALQEAERSYWLRRAEVWEAVKPRPGDYPGQTTVEERRRQWRRAHRIATYCRHRAELALTAEWPEVPLLTTEDEWERLEAAYGALGEDRWAEVA